METVNLGYDHLLFMPSNYNTTQDYQVKGSKFDDRVYTFGGNDLLKGGCGDDFLWTGSGDDTVRGGCGRDIILGGSGDDRLFGGRGDDLIAAGDGNNLLKGGCGHDRITINGDWGNNKLDGGTGNDVFTVLTMKGENRVWGGAGADTLRVAPYGSRTNFIDFVYGEDVIEVVGVSSNDVTVRCGDVFYKELKVVQTSYNALTVDDLVFSSTSTIG